MPAPTITLAGRLTADPELRFTPNGVAMCRFTVATSNRRKNDNGEWQDVDRGFWQCIAWRQLAEELTEQLRKGRAVVMHGTAYERKWETPEGEKRSRVEVRVDAGGPDLRWPKPAERASSGDAGDADSDPWATSSQESSDEPPF